jgi:hypothetical protein
MPFFFANRSHFVGGLGFGSGFSRGSWVVGAGSVSKTPSGVDETGQVVSSWFMRAWAPSRAVEERTSSLMDDEDGKGFRS